MKTLYVDVYFLINFTVDILALHFASVFSKVPVSIPRLLASGFIGAMYAVFGVLFIDKAEVMLFASVIIFILIILVATHGVSTVRKSKYAVSFFTFQIIIGGLVYFLYCALDKYVSVEQITDGGENRKLLILSLIVLLSIGIIKIIISAFGTARSEKNVKLIIEYDGKEHFVEALVDSGNLATDPFDKTPVMLITSDLSERLFGYRDISPTVIGYDIKRRIRVIPVNFGAHRKILYAIKPDGIYIEVKKHREKISLIIAIDKEGDNYGGYSALVPLSALNDVFYGDNKLF